MLSFLKRASAALKVESLEIRNLLSVSPLGYSISPEAPSDVAACSAVYIYEAIIESGRADEIFADNDFFTRDYDGDGAPDFMELRDGNNDYISDAIQPNVGSVSIGGEFFVTVEVPVVHRLANVSHDPDTQNDLSGDDLVGTINFDILPSLGSGGHTTAKIFLPEEYHANTFYDDAGEFLFDGLTKKGAIIGNETIEVYYDTLPVSASATPVFVASTGSNVNAGVINEQLFIEGSTQDDNIQVERLRRNMYQVTGLRGSTVNGSYAPMIFSGVRQGMNVNLKDGDDYAMFGGLSNRFGISSGQFIVQTGDGNDIVSISNSYVGAYARIETGSGIDLVNIADTRFNTRMTTFTMIDLGENDDRLNLHRLKTDGLMISQGGLGDDVIDIQDSLFWWHWRRGGLTDFVS